MLNKDQVLDLLAANNAQQALLHGAVIGDVSFVNHIFETPAMFCGAQFLGQADFTGATFKQAADFSAARFNKPALFLNCRFEKGGNFSLATFQTVNFFQAVFYDAARFWRAFFLDEANFSQIKVLVDKVTPANFESEANFSWARFTAKAVFTYAEFHHPVYFHRTLFKGNVLFEECRFLDQLILNGKQNDVLISRFELINPDSIAELESLGLVTKDTERYRIHGTQLVSEFMVFNNVLSEKDLHDRIDRVEKLSQAEKYKLLAEWREGAQPMFQDGALVSFRNARFQELTKLECQYVNFEKVDLDRDIFGSPEERVIFENRLKTDSYDVFISHASEDKEAVARPLANKLREMGLLVFFDESEIEVGAQLMKSLDSGIHKSKYGVILLSPDFIRKKWTKYELDELLQLSNSTAKKLFPLWYNVNEAQLQAWSAPIANHVALPIDGKNIDDVALKLARAMR